MLTIITGNPGKVREVSELLGQVLAHHKLDLVEIQSLNPVDVITHKLDEAYKTLGRAVLVEDTSLKFKAFGNLPGTLIKFFELELGLNGLVELLNNKLDKSATALTYFGYLNGKDKILARGLVEGRIVMPIGENGFGWDQIFIPNGTNFTFAQMESSQKNLISHRALAALDLKQKLETINLNSLA